MADFFSNLTDGQLAIECHPDLDRLARLVSGDRVPAATDRWTRPVSHLPEILIDRVVAHW